MLRFIVMEMADSRSFNGSTESEPRLIDVVLTKAERPRVTADVSAGYRL